MVTHTDPSVRFCSAIIMNDNKWRVIDMSYNRTVIYGLSREDADRVAQVLNDMRLPIDNKRVVSYYELGAVKK